jgi:hypothetical protein
MSMITRTGGGLRLKSTESRTSAPRSSSSLRGTRRRCGFRVAAALVAFPLLTDLALAEEAPLKVAVNGAVYLVNGDAVTGAAGTEPPDAATEAKARFTARVVGEQILHSQYNKKLFDPVSRATVLADQASGRLIEPWRHPLGNGAPAADGDELAFAKARDRYKAWVSRLANDPGELRLAIMRQDYLAGIEAFNENAAVYRNLAKRNQPLAYDDAVRLMRNEWLAMRLDLARTFEERLGGGSAMTTSNNSAPAPPIPEQLRRRLAAEVIDRIDSDVKTGRDFDVSQDKLRAIVMTDPSMQDDKIFDDYLKELNKLSVRFELWAAANNPKS